MATHSTLAIWNYESFKEMINEHSDHVRMTGAELSAQAILSHLENNIDCRSGILGINDQLNVVSSKYFKCDLRNVSIMSELDEIYLANATGIIAFYLVDNNIFISHSTIINKLNCSCEALGITLIDVMLFGAQDWISLRQQNRL